MHTILGKMFRLAGGTTYRLTDRPGGRSIQDQVPIPGPIKFKFKFDGKEFVCPENGKSFPGARLDGFGPGSGRSPTIYFDASNAWGLPSCIHFVDLNTWNLAGHGRGVVMVVTHTHTHIHEKAQERTPRQSHAK